MKIIKEKKWKAKTTVLIFALLIGFMTIQLVSKPEISGETEGSSFSEIVERQKASEPQYLEALNSDNKEVTADTSVEESADDSSAVNGASKSTIMPRAIKEMNFNVPVFDSIGRYRIKIIGNSNVQSFYPNDLLSTSVFNSIYAFPKHSDVVPYIQVNAGKTPSNSTYATLTKA